MRQQTAMNSAAAAIMGCMVQAKVTHSCTSSPARGSSSAVRFWRIVSESKREPCMILSFMRNRIVGAMLAGERESRKTALVGVWE